MITFIMGNFKPFSPSPRAPQGGGKPTGRSSGGRPPFKRGGFRKDMRRGPAAPLTPAEVGQSAPLFATPTDDKVRVIVLGGLEEVGINCTLIEYKDDIILVDLGLMFPTEEMPGVDYLIPNMSYVRGKEKNIRGVIITHGHYDHIGAIPHVVPKIGNPTVYALPVAAGIINKRQTDFPESKVNVKTLGVDSTIQLGVFKVHFFHINHNIPDSVGIVIETPNGIICHTGDWKYDFHPVGAPPADFHKMARLGEQGVTLLMGDSTNADRAGHQKSEKIIGEELESIIQKARGRVIVGTFASLLSRVKQIMEISERHGRKIALDGYSMKTNVEIAKELGYIKVAQRSIIPIEQANELPPDKVTIICTGAQGEKNAALSRIANDEHRFIKIDREDTLIFSSSVIPGNEASVQRLKDLLYRKRARVIHKDLMDVHAGGHAMKEDIKLMLSLFKPKYYMPIEGNHFLLRENAEVAYSMGWSEENVFVADNGQIIEIYPSAKPGVLPEAKITKEKVPTDHVYVDGLGVGDISQVVLRDRQAMAEDGMLVVIAQFEQHTGRLITEPDIVSRGFIQMKENKEFVTSMRQHLAKALHDVNPATPLDPEQAKSIIREELGKFLFQKTERRPMILPVIIEV
ncbi:ribonuclease J [bacterium]|nr:ribonuclease J [bacterium]NBX49550.1 ribonuclease J [bacterium]